MPGSRRSRVDFPAPFAPTSPITSPRPAVQRGMSRQKLPWRTITSLSSITASVMTAPA